MEQQTSQNGLPVSMGRPLWDVAGLAKRLGVTERFVRRLVAERRVPFYKIGKFVRFDPDHIDAWLVSAAIEDR